MKKWIVACLILLLVACSGTEQEELPSATEEAPTVELPEVTVGVEVGEGDVVSAETPTKESAENPTITPNPIEPADDPTATPPEPTPDYVENRLTTQLRNALQAEGADQAAIIIDYLQIMVGEKTIDTRQITIDDFTPLIRAAEGYMATHPDSDAAFTMQTYFDQIFPPDDLAWLPQKEGRNRPSFQHTWTEEVVVAHGGLIYKIITREDVELGPITKAALQSALTMGIDTLNGGVFTSLTKPDIVKVSLVNDYFHDSGDNVDWSVYAATSARVTNGMHVCNIVVYIPGLDQTLQGLSETIVHELFHCIQAESYPVRYNFSTLDNEYVIEQTAEWFMFKVFPDINWQMRKNQFDHNSPNETLIDMPYEGVFFPLFLESKFNDQAVIDYLADSPTSLGKPAQFEYLANTYTDVFKEFAEDYLDDNLLGLNFNPRLNETQMEEGQTYFFNCPSPFMICRDQLIFDGATTLEIDRGDDGTDSASPLETTIWAPLPTIISADCPTNNDYDLFYFTTQASEPYEFSITVGEETARPEPIPNPFTEPPIDPALVGTWEIVGTNITTQTIEVAGAFVGTQTLAPYNITGSFCFRGDGTLTANYQLNYVLLGEFANGDIMQTVSVWEGRNAFYSADSTNGKLITAGFIGPSNQTETRITSGDLAKTFDPFISNSATLDVDIFVQNPIPQIPFSYQFDGDQLIFTPEAFGQVPEFGITWLLKKVDGNP